MTQEMISFKVLEFEYDHGKYDHPCTTQKEYSNS